MSQYGRLMRNRFGIRVPHKTICSIMPDFLYKDILETGSSEDREKVLESIQITDQIRGERKQMAKKAIESPSAGGKVRTVYDAKNGYQLPGMQVRVEGSAESGDPAVDEAYHFSGATYDFYLAQYGRHSINDNELPLDSSVHFGKNYDNAMWNGRYMIYGDGGIRMNRTTQCVDVVAHELTHGVTQFEAGLDYFGEPGALNESWSDVMGILVKQYLYKQSANDSNWLLGEGLLKNQVALRSLKDPSFAGIQPGHMNEFKAMTLDNGGVHVNSGIPNKAFYLAATEMGGNAWEEAGTIWYTALRDRLRPFSKFSHAAFHTVSVAGNLFGENSKQQSIVRNAWESVGVKVEKPTEV